MDLVCSSLMSWPRYLVLHISVLRFILDLDTDGDPGPFCLAHCGLYIRAKNVGSDLHAGFALMEDHEAHKCWVVENLSATWNVAGPQNRVRYVSYIGGVLSDWLGSINIGPPTLFGNYGSSQAHKSKQKNFAMHGHNVLRGTMQKEWVEKLWPTSGTVSNSIILSLIKT